MRLDKDKGLDKMKAVKLSSRVRLWVNGHLQMTVPGLYQQYITRYQEVLARQDRLKTGRKLRWPQYVTLFVSREINRLCQIRQPSPITARTLWSSPVNENQIWESVPRWKETEQGKQEWCASGQDGRMHRQKGKYPDEVKRLKGKITLNR